MNKAQLISKVHVVAEKSGLPFNTVLTHYFLEAVFEQDGIAFELPESACS